MKSRDELSTTRACLASHLTPFTDPWGRQGVYHWTVSTGFSIAESTNFALGSPGELIDTLDGWVEYLDAAAGAALGWLSSVPDGSQAAQVRIAWSVAALRSTFAVSSTDGCHDHKHLV